MDPWTPHLLQKYFKTYTTNTNSRKHIIFVNLMISNFENVGNAHNYFEMFEFRNLESLKC